VTRGEGRVGRVEGVRCLGAVEDTEGLAIGVYIDAINETLVEREGDGILLTSPARMRQTNNQTILTLIEARL